MVLGGQRLLRAWVLLLICAATAAHYSPEGIRKDSLACALSELKSCG